MVFSSNIFLFAFLPLFLATYYCMPMRGRSALILLFSYVFYAWWRPDFLSLLVGVTVLTYAIALVMDYTQDAAKRYRVLFAGVALNLCALAYFKYANFGIDSLNTALLALGFTRIEFTHVLLPIGLSFYIFHAISYLVDIYRREAPPARNLVDFAAFIALFPHLVAGPVLRYHLLAEQFRSRTHTLEKFSQGCVIFMVGFCKKVLIADTVAPLADAAFAAPIPTMADAWLGAVAYTIQLFFDFSGYTDMAIGLALMIGFVFPENFNDPYTSRSITEFWKRWHMSLSNWLREYLYVSLGGNRKGVVRTYINLFLTMLLGGLWHGANWTFVLWGAWHGGILALERYWLERFKRPLLPAWLGVIKTMLLVMIGWVMFRAVNLASAGNMFAGMLGMHGLGFSPEVSWQVSADRVGVLVVGIALVYAMPWLRKNKGAYGRYLLVPLFVWAVATLSSQSFTPFLYFQF
ncbi:MBOAT family O-acyltransferase [Rhodoferax aquaticus]|uniref:Probable alginate O-acetylase AlgI n=1 Tax=Rhodoferax aquaticus TaxID=2527691 RepID=A0A515EKA2_9BURK|nr:MBOAT family protein [Rhodoferax aquaticus]QDL53093.1 MBOAT family protein [Rhodoferax aquaticus]